MKSWYFPASVTAMRRSRWGGGPSLLRDNAETFGDDDDNDDNNNTKPSVLSMALLFLPVLILHN